MKKLVFIHTNSVLLGRINGELKKKLGDISIENLMDDTLSKVLKVDRSKALERLNTLVKLGEGETAAEDVEVVITCTALSELSKETYRKTTMIDSYLHKGGASYKNILLVATNESAILPNKNGIARNEGIEGREIDEIFVREALGHFKNGDKELHDEMVRKEVEDKISDKRYEAIVLCQPSLSHLKNHLESLTGIEVLTGIDYFIDNYSWGSN